MGQVKQYDKKYKEEAVKLAEEKGCKKASEELSIPHNTLYGWIRKARNGEMHMEERSTKNVNKLEDELQRLKRENKEKDKEIKRLQEENEFLSEATAFFAASRRRSAKTKE